MSHEGLQVGRYRLLRLIGSGGMGEVYLAADTQIDRRVAIKLFKAEDTSPLSSDLSRRAVRLFRREMKTIAMLDHPHILPLFDYGEENVNGLLLTYMVMPFRKDGSLAAWLRRRSSKLLPLNDIEHFLFQAADALQYAHDHQIIHRDVKSSNFLIHSRKDNPDRPDLLLADFGIAKFNSAIASLSSSIRGTPTYMAPEQWKGQPVPATDQYALGVMIYELLTGYPPFQGGLEQVMYLHINAEPEPPSTLNPSIHPDLDAVILRTLAKKPEDRFVSVSAFAQTFQGALLSTDVPSISRIPEPQQALPSINAPTIPNTSEPQRALPSASAPTIPNTSEPQQALLSISAPTIPNTSEPQQALPSASAPAVPAVLNKPDSDNLGMVLAISKTEALNGASYTLTLPGGRRVNVSIPAGAYDGQVIHLEGRDNSGKPAADALILTLVVAHSEGNPAIESSLENPAIERLPIAGIEKTVQSSPVSSPDRTIESPSTADPQGFINRLQRLPTGIAILLVGLLLLVIGEGGGLFYVTGINSVAAVKVTATAEARTITTTHIATVTTTITTSANATTPALQNPYPPFSGTLVLNDPLNNNSQGYNWDESTGTCQFSARGYLITETQQKRFQYCTARATDFSNFAYQVQMVITKGDYGGIIFRANATTGQYYYLRIGQDGSYVLLLYVDNQASHARILTSGLTPFIHIGLNQSNLVAVVARNSTIDLYVNKQYITTVNDHSYSHGQIAVVAEDEGNLTLVLFSNARVWK
jgi:eukaryotic-like serine/threonine-protein kinase